MHTYRDVQEAVPYNPSYGVNCNNWSLEFAVGFEDVIDIYGVVEYNGSAKSYKCRNCRNFNSLPLLS